MREQNLGNAASFMVDALLTVEEDYGEIEPKLMAAALHITRLAWNAEVRGDAVRTPSDPVLSSGVQASDEVWQGLILNTSQELINIMRQRKQIFFSDDTRLMRRCFCNALGTISVEEDNEDGTLHVGH